MGPYTLGMVPFNFTWKLNTRKVYRKYDVEYQYNKHSGYQELYWTSRIDSILDHTDTK